MKKTKNKLPENIFINSSTLELILQDYKEKLATKKDWVNALSIFLAFLLCLMVSDFKDKFGLKALQWETIIEGATIFSFFWFLHSIYKALNTDPYKDLISDISGSIKNFTEYTAIYFIRITKGNIPRILVERNMIWDCFFLPYVHYSPLQSIDIQRRDHLTKTIAGFLGIDSGSVQIEHLEDCFLTSEKFSESEKIQKQFNFEFFYIRFSCETLDPDCMEYHIGGKRFMWLTLDELENDEKTKKKNGDVISHVKKHYNVFFHQTKDSIA